MRIIVTSDNHLNAYYAKMTPRQLEVRRKRIRDGWQQVVDYAVETRADVLLQAGDLFDMPDPRTTELVSAARDFNRLKEAGVRVFAIGGTHDMHRIASDGALVLRIYQETGLIRVFHRTLDPEPEVIDLNGFRVAIGGISVDHRLSRESNPLEGVEYKVEADYRILMLHYGVEGDIHPDANEPILKKDALAELEVDLVVVGHVHTARKSGVGKMTILVPGSTERHTFGERGVVPGFWELKVGPSGLQGAKNLPVSAQPMNEMVVRSTEMPDENPTEYVIDRIRQESDPDQMLKCRLEGPISQERFHKLRLREVFQLGNDLNFYFELDSRQLMVSDPTRIVTDAPESVAISQKAEIQAAAYALSQSADNGEDKALWEEAARLALSRYQG